MKRRPGRKALLIEDKVSESDNNDKSIYKARNKDGHFKNWVVCQFLRQELELLITDITSNASIKKVSRSEAIFKRGMDKISEVYLKCFISFCKSYAEEHYPNKFRLDLFTFELFNKKFKCISELNGYLRVIAPINVNNVKLEEKIVNDDATNKLRQFIRYSPKSVALLTGPVFSGKTTTMSIIYDELVADDRNIIYIDLSTVTNVTFLQKLLIVKLRQRYTHSKNTNERPSDSLIDLLNLRKNWVILLDTDDISVHADPYEKLASQNDYMTFIMRLNRKVSSEIKIIISEHFSRNKLPEHFENQIVRLEIEPVIPVTYINDKYKYKKNQANRDIFKRMALKLVSWSEEKRHVYVVLLELLEVFGVDKDYKELCSTFDKSFDINSLLNEYILKFRPKKYSNYLQMVLESLTLITEGLERSSLEWLCLKYKKESTDEIDEKFCFEDFTTNDRWLKIFLIKPMSDGGKITLQPAIRLALNSAGVTPSYVTHKCLLALCIDKIDKSSAKKTTGLLFSKNLSKPKNFLKLHAALLPGLHAFKIRLSMYHYQYNDHDLSIKDKSPYNTIKELYQLYDNAIEFNHPETNKKKSGFALGKVFLAFTAKLKLVSDIIGLNTGADNGRLITQNCALMRALSVDQIFYLLESYSVSGIGCLKFSAVERASGMLSSLYNLLIENPENTLHVSIAKRCRARIYQNDIALKHYFNPISSDNPVLTFTDVLISDINNLDSSQEILPSASFYYRRLTKLWLEHARYLLLSNPCESFLFLSALPYESGFVYSNEPNEFSTTLESLIDVDFHHESNKTQLKLDDTEHRKKAYKTCMSTYVVTSSIYITQRNLLNLYLDKKNKKFNSKKKEVGSRISLITPDLCWNVLKRSFDNLLMKSKNEYGRGINNFASLYSYKTALLRGVSTCEYLFKAKEASSYRAIINVPALILTLKELKVNIQKLNHIDDNALFLNTDTSHLISSSHYLVRKCISLIDFETRGFSSETFNDIKNDIKEINHKITQLSRTREVRLTLELEFFLKAMKLLLLFSSSCSGIDTKDEDIREFREDFTQLFTRFKRQGRAVELTPVFNEIFSCMNSCMDGKAKYSFRKLVLVIIMFF